MTSSLPWRPGATAWARPRRCYRLLLRQSPAFPDAQSAALLPHMKREKREKMPPHMKPLLFRTHKALPFPDARIPFSSLRRLGRTHSFPNSEVQEPQTSPQQPHKKAEQIHQIAVAKEPRPVGVQPHSVAG